MLRGLDRLESLIGAVGGAAAETETGGAVLRIGTQRATCVSSEIQEFLLQGLERRAMPRSWDLQTRLIHCFCKISQEVIMNGCLPSIIAHCREFGRKKRLTRRWSP